MTDIANLVSFPNLGTDSAQIAMVATSFAAQADFFARFAGLGSEKGLYNIAQTFALIGFMYVGLVHSAWRGIVLGPWFIILILMTLGPSYTGGSLFFIKLNPHSHQGLVSPIDPLRQFTAEELLKIREESSDLGELASRFSKPIDQLSQEYDTQNGLFLYGPQAGLLHAMNNLARDVAQAFFAPGGRTFQDRIVAAQTLANAKTGDYRVGYIQATFRSVCTAPNPEWDRLFATTTVQMANEYSGIYKKWEERKLTFEDFITMHLQFYASQHRLEDFVKEASIDGDVSTSNFGRFLAPSLLLESTLNTFKDEYPDIASSLMFAGLNDYAFTSGRDTRRKFREYAQAETRADKEAFFEDVLLPLSEDKTYAPLLRQEIGVLLPIATNSGVSTDKGLITFLFGGEDPITNCKQLHAYMHKITGDLAEENLHINSTAAAFADRQYELCRANEGADCENLHGLNWESLNETQKIFLGYQYAKRSLDLAREECIRVSREVHTDRNCLAERQDAKKALELGLIANVLRGDQIIADGILENALSKLDQFRSPIRTTLAHIGEATAGVFVWLTAAFGGFAAGAYAAIMPLIISWGLALIIVITPFLYLMGLIIPGWSLMILLTPLIGVLYLKSVESTFVLIKGVFEMFHKTLGVGGILDQNGYVQGIPEKSGILGFYDLILGMGYTGAFGISLFLLFGLKNPAALAQQVGTSADKTAQISGGEVVKAAVAGAALFALPGKGLALAGGALKTTAKVAAAGERAGLVPTGVMQELSEASTIFARTRKHSHTQHHNDLLLRQSQAKRSYDDYQSRTKGAAKAEDEQNIITQHKGNDNNGAVKGQKPAFKYTPDRQILKLAPVDNAIDALTAAFAKIGERVGKEINLDRHGMSLSKHKGYAKHDNEAYDRDLTIANSFSVEALLEDGNVTKEDIELGIKQGEFTLIKGSKGEDRIHYVVHQGLEAQAKKLGFNRGSKDEDSGFGYGKHPNGNIIVASHTQDDDGDNVRETALNTISLDLDSLSGNPTSHNTGPAIQQPTVIATQQTTNMLQNISSKVDKIEDAVKNDTPPTIPGTKPDGSDNKK